jgi:hypothetical protein
MYDIQPSSLTDDEFMRLCRGILILETLPVEYQEALFTRFVKLLDKLDALTEQQTP